MKASYIIYYSNPEGIYYGDLDDIEISAGEVKVKTICVSVNRIDTHIRSGRLKTNLPMPFILGRDFVGIVEEVASDVDSFKIGDLVWSNAMGQKGRQGVTSDYVVINKDLLYSLPEKSNPFKIVSSIHLSTVAYILLHDLSKAQKGEKLFVHGLAGHLGKKLLEIGIDLGLEVCGASHPDDFENLKKLGASIVYSYLEDLNTNKKYDIVIDTSGVIKVSDNISLLKAGGRLPIIAGSGEAIIDIESIYLNDYKILGFNINDASDEVLKKVAVYLNKQFENNKLLDEDIRVYKFSEISEAHKRLESPTRKKPRYILVPDELEK